MGLLSCVIYIAVLGVAGFVLGRLLPKEWFDHAAFPYAPLPWEKDGAVYNRLHIRKWQSKVPDMSRVFKRWMPPKKLVKEPDAQTLERMLQETCVAEFIHFWLSVAGLGCLWLWRGLGGAAVTAVYILLGNLPFILIQRFNRPRLAKLLRRARGKAQPAEGVTADAYIDPELQYGTRA